MKRKIFITFSIVVVILSVLVIANYHDLLIERAKQFTVAAGNGNLRRMRILLLLGADVNANAPGNGPALIAAARQGHNEIIQFLLDHSANVNTHDKFGGTALIAAVNNGQTETIKLLLSKGANVNAVGDEGSALRVARKNNYTEIVDLLEQRGAKDCNEHQYNDCS